MGSATMSASGGAPFTYTWSPSGGNAATATGLSAGTYTCATTNSCGATANRTVNITQPSVLTSFTAATNVLCNGGATGSATVTGVGGVAPYTYAWNSGQNTSVVSGLLAGVKRVTITDANGCVKIVTVVIFGPSTALSTATAVTNV